MSAAPRLDCRGLHVAAGGRTLVAALDLQLRAGELLAVLGRNGSGKSLTLQTLAGLRAPAGGSVYLEGADLATLPRRRLARRLAFLPQDREEGFATSALDCVLVARHPHLKLWEREGASDVELAQTSLAEMGLADFEDRSTGTLSGGEHRRVALAGLLAQQPQLYLLDEPTNHLDPQFQIDVLSLFRARCDAGASVIATLHDPTLAARFADSALLLQGDGRWRAGEARELITAGQLSELYDVPMLQLAAGERRVFAVG